MSFPFRGDTMNGIIRYLHIIDQIISLTLTPSSTWPGFQVSPIVQSNLNNNHLVSGNENNPSVRFSFTGIKPIVPSFSIVSHSTPGYAIHSFDVDGSDTLSNWVLMFRFRIQILWTTWPSSISSTRTRLVLSRIIDSL